MDIQEAFEQADGEFLKFDRIENPPCRRRDICAFIKLDQLVPGHRDIVAHAEHDEIYLDVEADELAAVATQDDIVYLHRCGVRWSTEADRLSMFV